MVLGKEISSYGNHLARLCDWNYTTVVRTHYKMKENIADKKVEQLVKYGIANNVFFTLENDRDYIDRYTKTPSVNHMHLLLHLPNKIHSYREERTKLCEALGVNRKAVLDIEPIKDTKQLSKYITKHLTMVGSHHNYFGASTGAVNIL
jgi:hypothetical protein